MFNNSGYTPEELASYCEDREKQDARAEIIKLFK
jgi:hypothetical protein